MHARNRSAALCGTQPVASLQSSETHAAPACEEVIKDPSSLLTSSRLKQKFKRSNNASCKTRNQTPRQAQKDIRTRQWIFPNKIKALPSAKEAVERGLKFAYSGRKQKKRQYRSIWIVRIGAAAKLNGMSYSQFIHGLKKAGVELDRKILADIAVKDAGAFKSLAEQAKRRWRKEAAISLQPSVIQHSLE